MDNNRSLPNLVSHNDVRGVADNHHDRITWLCAQILHEIQDLRQNLSAETYGQSVRQLTTTFLSDNTLFTNDGERYSPLLEEIQSFLIRDYPTLMSTDTETLRIEPPRLLELTHPTPNHDNRLEAPLGELSSLLERCTAMDGPAPSIFISNRGENDPAEPLLSPQSSESSDLFATLMHHVPSRCIISKTMFLYVVTMVVVALSVVLAVMMLSQTNDLNPVTPDVDRETLIWRCVEIFSKLESKEDASSQINTVVDAFLFGAAKDIDVPNECHWNSVFGVIYSLFVIRESLSVPHHSWYQPFKKKNVSNQYCNWPGIHCDLLHRVQGIYLNDANITGTIPKEIIGLSESLTTLQLDANSELKGLLISELGLMSELRSLQLHQTGLAGPIPASLGQLSNLEELFMHKTQLSGTMPKDVCKLRNLHLELLEADCRYTQVLCSCCTKCT